MNSAPEDQCKLHADHSSASSSDDEEQPATSGDPPADAPKYKFTNLEGQEFTVEELVAMERSKDERFSKLRKRELPDEYWVLWRKGRNKNRSLKGRERLRRKKLEQRQQIEQNLATISPEERALVEKAEEEARELAKKKHQERQLLLQEAHAHGLRIAVECSFVESASDRELRSLARQLQFCTAVNKRTARPGALHFTSFQGALKEFSIEKMQADRWLAHFYAEPAVEIFPSEDLIVLSPDAEEPLENIDSSKVYLIGGIVDRTVQKHITATFAEDKALRARRLPLQEHLGRQAVLNVNHVAEILLAVHGGESWGEVLKRVVPERKLKKPKDRKAEREAKEANEAKDKEEVEIYSAHGDKKQQIVVENDGDDAEM